MHHANSEENTSKPWEESFRRHIPSATSLPMASAPLSSISRAYVSSDIPSLAPPVPQRRDAPAAASLGAPYGSNFGLGGFNTNYSPYGFGGLGGMGIGSFGGGMGIGMQNGALSQQVEAGLRPAFDSIHSVVQTVSSVAVMLESTYFALFNSVRALTGVADHLGNMTAQIRTMIVSLRLFRLIKYLWRYLAHLIGLTDSAPQEGLWETMRQLPPPSVVGSSSGQQPAAINWPLALFFVMSLGGPVLLWRLVSSLMPKSGVNSEQDEWMEGRGEHYIGKALYHFTATREDELSVMSGEALRVAPKEQQARHGTPNGWLLAARLDSENCAAARRHGFVPANFVNILGLASAKDVTTEQSKTAEAQPNILPQKYNELDDLNGISLMS